MGFDVRMNGVEWRVFPVMALLGMSVCHAALDSTPASTTTIERVPASWTWAGWGGGGFFWPSVFDPANANTIYLGGDVAGVYKSVDQGKNWRFINRGLHEYGAFSLAVAKSRPSTLYVMTPDGMAKSENGGEDWLPLATARKGQLNLSANKPGSVRAVAIDPRDSETVYAGSTAGVLCKSTDGGKTWTKLDYLSALDSEPHAAVALPPPAPSGTNYLTLAFASAANDWNHHGRAEKFISAAGADWSAYGKLTASILMPVGAPKLEAQLVVQSGPNWLWQAGPNVSGTPGKWTDVSLDLTTIKNLQAVHIVYLVVRSPGIAWRGEIGLDAVTLIPSASEGKPRLLGDWKKPGSLDGWKAGSHTADAPFISALRNSAEAGPALKSPIATVAIAESNPQLIFVAHRTLGIFRSEDAGASWRRVWKDGAASAVSVYPRDAKIVYAALETKGVWKSVDAGLTWSPATTGITNKCGIRDVAVDPRSPDVVHAIGEIGWGGSFYHSKDGGQSWACVRTFLRDMDANPTLPEETGSGEHRKGTGGMSRVSSLALAPSAPDTLFIGANWNNFLSTDGGKSWVERIRGADITCIQDITFCGDKTYVVAMDEGLLVSENKGQSWRQLAPLKYTMGMSGHQWRVLAWKQGDKEHVVSTVSPWQAAKEYPNYALVSDDGGKTFTKGTQGLPDYLSHVNCMWGQSYARALAADPKDPSVLYLGMDGDPEPAKGRMGGGIFKSTDGGLTWAQLPNQPASRRGFFGLAVDPTEPKRIFWASVSGLSRSEDGGVTWKTVLPGWLFNVHVAADGTVYAGDKDVRRSTDHGQTWKQVSQFKMEASLVGMTTDPNDSKRLWVSLVTWDGSDRGAVFRTSDGGKSWQEITGDLPYRKPLVLRYNQATRELWAGGVGLFRLAQ